MSREKPGAYPLFDLLGRQWRLPAPAASVAFDRESRALAAALSDGRVALILTDDDEAPEQRIAADETGRRTISPRRGAPRPAIVLPAKGAGPALISAAARGGFVVAHGDGALEKLAPDGEAQPLAPAPGVRALDASAGAFLALVRARGVELREESGRARLRLETAGVQTVAVSPEGERLAYGCGAEIVVADVAAPFTNLRRYVGPERVERLVWSADGAFLAATCGASGVALLDVAANRFGVLGGFPSPPRSLAFSEAARALVVSGAYRIAAWDLAHPPFDGAREGALETGRAGLTPVAEVAALARGRLVGAAYANGQLVIAALGGRDELLLQASGPAPTGLAGSPDGRLLALAAGEFVALLSLPDALFK